MHASDENARRRAWSSFWASGALHSCVGSFADNYEGAIGGFWRDQFGQLPSPAAVLDLATGNGALPRLLREMSEGEDPPPSIHAVDLARVAPRWFRPELHRNVSFHPGVGMEALPFADQSFDLVTSQYGLEYARWPDALDEAARVCRPDGRLAFALHHADSVIVRVGRAELSQQRLLLAGDGLLAAAMDVLPWIAKARAADPAASGAAARAARERYNLAMAHVGAHNDAEQDAPLLAEARAFVHGLLGGRMGTALTAQARLLAEFRQALEEASVRTEEMLDCALDEAKVKALAEALGVRRPGGKVDVQTLAQQEGVLGWSVVAH